MDDFLGDLVKRTQALGANWTSYTALGSFALYVLGYLTLRFHLTALGIGADLSVLDERYLFTGARFLIYLISSIPSLIFLVVLLVVPVYLLFRILPSVVRVKLYGFFRSLWAQVLSWLFLPNRLVLASILFSLLMIQLVMRQCFLLSNLLLAADLPAEPSWFRGLLLAKTDGPMALYFSALLAGVAIPLSMFYILKKQANTNPSALYLTSLLGFLLFVQFLLIPVNYGILVVDKSMPRVTGLDTSRPFLQDNEQAWLVWEGNEGKTFLLRKQHAGKDTKSLITVSRKAVKKLEIIGYDRIFEILFGATLPVYSNKGTHHEG
jgi:hypothetical protein